MSEARLEVTDAFGQRIVTIDKTTFAIGRRDTNDLRLAGSEVSRDHAEIRFEGGRFTIRDRGSRYGSFVNGEAITERELQTSMEKLMQGRTSIVIAHRLATIRKADRILVFEKGVLKQSGSHAELMREDGIYRELVNIQTAGRGDPSVDPGDNAEIAANNGNGEATGAVA